MLLLSSSNKKHGKGGTRRSSEDSEEQRDNFDGTAGGNDMVYDNDGRGDQSALSMTQHQMSDSKAARKRLYMQKPVLVDISESQTEASTLAPVKEQIDTLKAIQAYN